MSIPTSTTKQVLTFVKTVLTRTILWVNSKLLKYFN